MYLGHASHQATVSVQIPILENFAINSVICTSTVFDIVFAGNLIIACNQGQWGTNCSNACNCSNNSPCDIDDGQCICSSGFIGEFCENICPPGMFGLNCENTCDCLNCDCDHISGNYTCHAGYRGERYMLSRNFVKSSGISNKCSLHITIFWHNV